MKNKYYVYIHYDPYTEENMYVGMGHGSRAYVTPTGNSNYSSRSSEHAKYLRELLEDDFLPHEWVKFEARGLERETAKNLERELVKELKPKFNREQKRQLSLNENDVKLVFDLNRQGLSGVKISKEIGKCCPTTIYEILRGKNPGYQKLHERYKDTK